MDSSTFEKSSVIANTLAKIFLQDKVESNLKIDTDVLKHVLKS